MHSTVDISALPVGSLLKALNLTAVQDWEELGQHPLSALVAVRAAREKARQPDTPAGRGKALGTLLRQAVASLAPARAYAILQARLDQVSPKVAAPNIGLSLDRWYAVQRDEAAPQLRGVLASLEQEACQEADPAAEQAAPFIVGLPITQPRSFFGREYELSRIFGLWRHFPLQNVAIMGAKRSGKTSLLHYLKAIHTAEPGQLRPGQRANWLPEPQRYQWVFVDFHDVRMHQRQRLLQHVLSGLGLPAPEGCDLPAFMDLIDQHLRTPAIILMDEIGAALTSPDLDQAFWWGLRSAGVNQARGNLGFVLTSCQPPAQIAQDQGKLSPFFNIFGHSFTLGPLLESEARELITSSPLPFEPADVEWILTESGRWPGPLQLLSHLRLEALKDSLPGAAWRAEGQRQLASFRQVLAKPEPPPDADRESPHAESAKELHRLA